MKIYASGRFVGVMFAQALLCGAAFASGALQAEEALAAVAAKESEVGIRETAIGTPDLPKYLGVTLEKFETYSVGKTSDYFNRVLIPVSEAIRSDWLEKLGFIRQLLEAAFSEDFASNLGDEYISARSIREEIRMLYILRYALKKYGYLPAKELDQFYTFVSLHLVLPWEKAKPAANNIYKPLKLWMVNNLPLCKISCLGGSMSYVGGEEGSPELAVTFLKERFLESMKEILLNRNLGFSVSDIDVLLKRVSDDVLSRVVSPDIPFYLYTDLELEIEGLIEDAVKDKKRKLEKKAAKRLKQNKRKVEPVKLSKDELAVLEAESEAAMRALELEFGDLPTAKGKKAKKRKADRKKKTLTKPKETLVPVVIDVVADEKKAMNIALAQATNAERNLKQAQRRKQLEASREDQKKLKAKKVETLRQRAQSKIDEAFLVYSRLKDVGVIDPSIFEGVPKLDDVVSALEAAGVSVLEHVHGNEKCLAMWKDVDGEKHMVWFDAPHGAQLRKGANAGWVRALKSKLQETGMLIAE